MIVVTSVQDLLTTIRNIPEDQAHAPVIMGRGMFRQLTEYVRGRSNIVGVPTDSLPQLAGEMLVFGRRIEMSMDFPAHVGRYNNEWIEMQSGFSGQEVTPKASYAHIKLDFVSNEPTLAQTIMAKKTRRILKGVADK